MNRPAAGLPATELPPSATDPDEVGRRPARAAWIRLAFLVLLLLALGSWVALGAETCCVMCASGLTRSGCGGRSSSRSSTPWP